MAETFCPGCPVAEIYPGGSCLAHRNRSVCDHPDRDTPAFRRSLLRQAEHAALLSAADANQLRRAETCPHREICDCRGYRCRGGRHDGQVVTIVDCLQCLSGE